MTLHEGHLPLPISLWLCVPTTSSHCQPHQAPLAPSPSNKQQPVVGGALSRRHWGPQSPFCFSLHTATQSLPWQPGQGRCGQGEKKGEGKGSQRGLEAGLSMSRVSVSCACTASLRVCWVPAWAAVRACECHSGFTPERVADLRVSCSVCLLVSVPGVCGSGYVWGLGACECVCLNRECIVMCVHTSVFEQVCVRMCV